MPAQFLLISRFPVKLDSAGDLLLAISQDENARIFTALDGDEIVTLRVMDAMTALVDICALLSPAAMGYASFLTGDVRRELLEFVEAPKTIEDLLPDTPYIQLRHVEVKPEAMVEYRDWRDRTIFDVVRTADEVEVFLAYHSVISGQPGVMFVSGFSTSPEQYGAVFASNRYKTIVQEAGEKFITGGTEGLYTKTYKNASKLAA